MDGLERGTGGQVGVWRLTDRGLGREEGKWGEGVIGGGWMRFDLELLGEKLKWSHIETSYQSHFLVRGFGTRLIDLLEPIDITEHNYS